MKNLIMKSTLLLAALLALNGQAIAQQEYKAIMQKEYKVEFDGGTIFIDNVNGVEIESYNGREVIVTADGDIDRYNECGEKKNDYRSEGLRLISGGNQIDNTGLGLSVKREGDTLLVQQVGNVFDCVDAVIKIPKSVNIKYNNSQITACDLIIKGIEREIEISKNYEDVELIDVTGPMTVKVVYGDIVGSFEKLSQHGSISLVSIYGDVEVDLKKNSKAELFLKTGYGDIYSNFDIEMKPNMNVSSSQNQLFGSTIRGTINKGGVEFIAKATYGDVVIRKK